MGVWDVCSAAGDLITTEKAYAFAQQFFRAWPDWKRAEKGYVWIVVSEVKLADYDEGDSNEPKGSPEPPLVFYHFAAESAFLWVPRRTIP